MFTTENLKHQFGKLGDNYQYHKEQLRWLLSVTSIDNGCTNREGHLIQKLGPVLQHHWC